MFNHKKKEDASAAQKRVKRARFRDKEREEELAEGWKERERNSRWTDGLDTGMCL